MTKRPLILRDYQFPASDFALDNDIAILAVAPNGGKTEISIHALSRYLNLNPKKKVLILTHSTNVLKDNYTDRLDNLEVSFKYSKTFDPKCQAHICLPNSEHLIKSKYDMLVVDEAHENYLAERVQRIIKKCKFKKQLLLTGTPSKFIKKGGYDIFTLAANAIPSEYFAKLQVELVASNYKWEKELNSDLEVKSKYNFKTKDTEITMENIILKLIDRVKYQLSPEEFNDPDIFAKLKKKWRSIFRNLGKTIIICRSIKQATDVNNILLKNNVKSVVSDSISDKESVEIIKFKDNKYDVLVVVDRTRLGYSDEHLYNIIDMSGSHSPNVIYQIFARVLRGNPSMQKYYLKVTSQEYGMMDFTHACVSAALMLTDNKYLSTFNGNNFNGIKIPILKKNKAKSSSESANGKTKPKNNKLIFPEFTNDVIDMFKNIIHNLDEPVSIYKLTTIGEVRAILNDRTKWTKEAVYATITGEYV